MNFQRLWEAMELAKEKEQPIEDKALSAVRTGLGIGENFWADFLQLINNADGLGALLDINPDKIGTWAEKINQGLKQVQASDESEDVKKNRKLIKTGTSMGVSQ